MSNLDKTLKKSGHWGWNFYAARNSSRSIDRNKSFSSKPAPRLSLWLMGILSLVFIGIIWNAQRSIAQVKTYALSSFENQINSEIDTLVNDKTRVFMGLAQAIAQASELQKILCNECDASTVSLTPLISQLSQSISYPNLWVQVLDAQGYSRYRSWTDKKDDYVLNVRRDLRVFFDKQAPMNSISVGKFTLSMKSTVPIYDAKKNFIGAVELIAPFDPMAQILSAKKVEPFLVANRTMRSNLIEADSKRFIDGYYLLNKRVEPDAKRFLEEHIQQILEQNFISFDAEHFWSSKPITNELGQTIGFWLIRFHDKDVYTKEINGLMQQTLYNSGALLTMLVLFLVIYLFKLRADKQHYYYRQIFNTASDILLVTDGHKLFEANAHFFEFFKDVKTLEQFNRDYKTLGAQFVEEPGWLKAMNEGQPWLDYVQTHPMQLHKAKMMFEGRPRYFAVKVMQLNQGEQLYTVALQDITQQVQYQNKLLSIANTDALTGIGNRLFFDKQLHAEVTRAHRYDSLVCLVVFDLDHFKHVNDKYGHDAGDTVLSWLSQAVLKQLRESDVFCRYGGEEFAVIMPETQLHDAASKAEQIRAWVEEQITPISGLGISLSFGIAELSIWDNDKTLFKRADNALYKAKQQGRNQVVKSFHEIGLVTQSPEESFRRHVV